MEITPQNLFAFDNSVLLLGEELKEGDHAVEVRRRGGGPLYINAYLSYFSLEEFIPAPAWRSRSRGATSAWSPSRPTAQVARFPRARSSIKGSKIAEREELADLAEVDLEPGARGLRDQRAGGAAADPRPHPPRRRRTMNILLLLVPISLVLLGVAIAAFVWAVRRGQFDDLDTPALDILEDDEMPSDQPREPSARDAG